MTEEEKETRGRIGGNSVSHGHNKFFFSDEPATTNGEPKDGTLRGSML